MSWNLKLSIIAFKFTNTKFEIIRKNDRTEIQFLVPLNLSPAIVGLFYVVKNFPQH